ncbi:MAG: DUF6263 family protein [Planctomycetota bacterium]
MFRSMLLASAVVVASTTVSSAQVSLKPLVNENAKVRTTIEVETDQTLTLNGMPLETKVSQFLITNDTIGERQADGKYTSNGSFETMQVEMHLPGGIELNFDSGNPKTEAAIPQLSAILVLFDAISSSKYETTFTAPGKIDAVKITGEKYEALDDALKAEFSPDRMKMEASQQLERLPANPINVGDKWTRTETSQLGSGQTFEIERTFEYLGTVNEGGRELDRVGISASSVTYAIEPNPALPLQVKDSDLKIAKSSGEFLFDRKLGATVKTTDSITVEGKLTLIANGAELAGDLKLTISSKTSRE